MPTIITTSYSGKRLSKDGIAYHSFKGIVNDVIVRTGITYQTHTGFGGAVTDATVDCYKSLGDKGQELINAYYSSAGLNYNLLRLTVHSSDFSAEGYNYTDGADMSTFSLEREDAVKIPLVKKCIDASNREITFFASPWSPPAWMKDNGDMCHGGHLREDCRETWAEYYARYLEELKKRGIVVKYVSVQNEPEAIQTWESREVDAIEEGEEIVSYLAPAFKRHNLNIKFFLWDHNRDRAVRRVIDSMSVEGVKEHVWGVGYHWYCCKKHSNLTALHELFPDLHILLSECCVELAHDSTTHQAVSSGTWKNGERYARQIINDLNNWSEGYIDWNLVLDERGGPNHAGNYCEAPIMLDGNGGIVYNPSYWHIAHFSKYIAPGAKRVLCSGGDDSVYQTAYVNPDGTIVIVILNVADKDFDTNVDIDGESFGIKLEKHSIVTILS